jgi:hypothetical protein
MPTSIYPAVSLPIIPGTSSTIFEGMITTVPNTTASKTVSIPAGDHIALAARSGSVSFSDGQSFALVANTPKVCTLPAGASSVTFNLASQIGNYYVNTSTTGLTALTAATNSYYKPSGQQTTAHTAGVWVYMGGTGTTYYTSTDGIAWTSRTSTFSTTWTIQGTNGLFFAFQASAGSPTTSFYTSPDGITWTLRTFPAGVSQGNIVYASTIGRYCVITSGSISDYSAGQTYSSTDGFNWTAGTLLSLGAWNNLAASPTRFLASMGLNVGGPSVTTTVAYSTTGTTFTSGNRVNSTQNGFTIYAPDGFFYSQNGFTGGPERSTDGVTWTNSPAGFQGYAGTGLTWDYLQGKTLSGSINGVTYYFMASNTNHGYSTDGTNWFALGSNGSISSGVPRAIISNTLIGHSGTTLTTRSATAFTPTSFGLYAGPATTI